MSNLVLDVENLDNLLEKDNLIIPVEIFSQIIDNIGESEIIFNKKFFIGIFYSIIIEYGNISETEANIFLALINSKSFRKSYIKIIREIEYISNDEVKKSNPLFNIGELKIKLNSLIIKSRLNNEIYKGKNHVYYEGDKYIKIGDESYKVLKKVLNISALLDKNGYISISQNNNGKQEILLSGINDITSVDKVGLNIYMTFIDKEGVGLYDIKSKKILLSGKVVIDLNKIKGEVYVCFIDKDGSGIYDIKSKELLLSGKKGILIKEIGGRIFLEFINEEEILLYDVKTKKIMIN